MYSNGEYLYEEFIIWNAVYGVRDFVTIGHIETDRKNTNAWLDEPYEMVGPFDLDELYLKGQIRFAACMVITKSKWEQDKTFIYEDSLKQKQIAQEQQNEQIRRYNQKRREHFTNIEENEEKKYRKLLSLPLEGILKISQIKIAYRKIVKKVHPDVGGDEEIFREVTIAKDILLEGKL